MCVYIYMQDKREKRAQNLNLTIYMQTRIRNDIQFISIFEILFRIFVFSFIIYFIDIICVDACAFPLFSFWDKMFLIFLPMIFILTFFNIFHKCHLIYRRYLFYSYLALTLIKLLEKRQRKLMIFLKVLIFIYI